LGNHLAISLGIIWDKNSQSVIADADYYGYHVLFSVNMYVNLATPYDDPSKFFKPMNAMQGAIHASSLLFLMMRG